MRSSEPKCHGKFSFGEGISYTHSNIAISMISVSKGQKSRSPGFTKLGRIMRCTDKQVVKYRPQTIVVM